MQMVEVALFRHSQATDRLYSYQMPESLPSVKPGARVVVPFGRGDTYYEGCVLNLSEDGYEEGKTKSVAWVLPEATHLTGQQVALVFWLKNQTLCSYSEALSIVIPPGTVLKRSRKWCLSEATDLPILSLDRQSVLQQLDACGGDPEKLGDAERKLALSMVKKGYLIEKQDFYSEIQDKQVSFISALGSEEDLQRVFTKRPSRMDAYSEILRFLNLVGPTAVGEVQGALGVSTHLLKTLEQKGLIQRELQRVDRMPSMLAESAREPFLPLTEEQETLLQQMTEPEAHKKPWLIHGVTGSGKTEVYLQLCRHTLAQGKSAVILVPEISLTPQIVGRFVKRFGGLVSVLHSRLSAGERHDQWRRIREGLVRIVIGPRSALFAPFDQLGLIVLDEEHEGAYKSESSPRYHARDVAQFLSEESEALLVLGSATPSVENYWRAKKGIWHLGTLEARVHGGAMPVVETVDMRDELLSGNSSPLSRKLQQGIDYCLSQGQQILIFLNRKGYAPYVSCSACGSVLKCPRCDISMTYYKGNGFARCSYCGYASEVAKTCPDCGGEGYRPSGQGTEGLEELLQNRWPQARIARLDADTTTKKGSLEDVIQRMEIGDVDILIGTQMIAKGLHFPNVTLVGVLAADQSLNLPDFRANERAFQLLTQVSGRTGRGDLAGRVLIQTFRPDHYTLECASGHDYDRFFKSEIQLRRSFRYPPYVELINWVLQGEKEETVLKTIKGLYNTIGGSLKAEGLTFQLLGPHPAILSRIKGQYRYQLFIKYLPQEEDQLLRILEPVVERFKETAPAGVRSMVDIRPMTTL